METLKIDPVIILAQIINFLVLLFILSRLLYQPLLKMLKERERKIEAGLDKAREADERMQNIERREEEILAQARAQTHTMLDEARRSGEKLREKFTAQAKLDAQQIVRRKEKELRLTQAKLRQEVKKEAAQIALQATQKLLADLDAETKATITDQVLSDLKSRSTV